MLFTSKNKSDVNLKSQRMQRFLRENINHAKTRQARVNSKRFAKFDTREGTPNYGFKTLSNFCVLFTQARFAIKSKMKRYFYPEK